MSSASVVRAYGRSSAVSLVETLAVGQADLKLVKARLSGSRGGAYLARTAEALAPTAEAKLPALVFASTVVFRPAARELVRHELDRLVAATRRLPGCLFCDLYRVSGKGEAYMVSMASTSRVGWLPSAGWERHPAGAGLLGECLLEPIAVLQMEEEEVA